MSSASGLTKRAAMLLGVVLTIGGMALVTTAGPALANCSVNDPLAVAGFVGTLVAAIGGYLIKHGT